MAHNKPKAWTKGGPSAPGSLTFALREFDKEVEEMELNLDEKVDAGYRRFCSFAKDPYFRGSLFANASTWRRSW